MDNIIKALVDAGYFRARINALPDFDKVIGGMAWAMQALSRDLNIDIFYASTLDLGQKIALTERLVMVLIVMNCPHQIEPHQIVGLDYANLWPVLNWLIKKSAEIRQEHEAFNRLLALRYFHRVTNSLPDRRTWCHVVPTGHLGQIDEFNSAKIEDSQKESTLLDTRTIALLDRISDDYKDNKRVSFVKLPSVLRFAARDTRGPSSKVDNFDSSDEEEIKLTEALASESARSSKANHASGLEQPKTESIDQMVDDSDSLEDVHKELDTELLATNQKILMLLKKLDMMPSDLEIVQYQRRYIELHQQLISKNKDLKKLYALFNSLDSVKHYLSKEINLLDSIVTNLELTHNSAVNRDQFLTQFQDIICKIQTVRDDVVARLNIIRLKCDELNEEYATLVSETQ